MSKMKLILVKIMFISCLAQVAYADIPQNKWNFPENPTTEQFFKKLHLTELVGNEKIRYFAAQMKNSEQTSLSVDRFDDFVILNNGPGPFVDQVAVTELDNKQKIIKQSLTSYSFTGVDAFSQKEIVNKPFQEGYNKAIIFANQQGYNLYELARFVVYKTLNTQRIIYDYVFLNHATGLCQEVLYTPFVQQVGQFEMGLAVNCHDNAEPPNLLKLNSSAFLK